MKARDPNGVPWDVSRRWLELPRWRRWRPRLDGMDGPWIEAFDPGDAGFVVAIVVVVLVLVFVFAGLPLIVFLLALAVALAGLASRVLFGRPWLVEAKSERGELAWRVRGTVGSRRAMLAVAAALERGDRDFTPVGATRVLPEPLLRSRR